MKTKAFTKILKIFSFLIFCNNSIYAQSKITVIDSAKDGTIKYALINKDVNKETDSKQLLKNLLNTKLGTDFYLYKKTKDQIGMVHEKYQQVFKGIKVEFREYIVHRDKENNIVSINGDLVPIDPSFSTKPENDFPSAIQKYISLKKIKAFKINKLPKENFIDSTRIIEYKSSDEFELVIIEGNDNKLHLCYKTWIQNDIIFGDNIEYIDCKTGENVYSQSLIKDANVPGTVQTFYSGSRGIIGDSFNSGFRLRESSRNGNTSIITLNYNRAPAYSISDVQNNVPNATDFNDNDNNWSASEHNNANLDIAALDVHWGSEMTVDYFNTVHNRSSFDGNNGTINNYVHVRTRDRNNLSNVINMDNAFWLDSYKSMFYGDGSFFGPTVSLDVTAHEIGHGVCYSSIGNGTGLAYNKESGALNESLSDMWGASVENWATSGKQTWLIGEDIVGFGGAFRSMSDPNSSGQPDTYNATSNHWYNINGCTPNSDTNDNCGVHTNSGVGNYWFYLISIGGSGLNDNSVNYNVTGFGITDASRIIYKAETNYLTSSSGYQNMRTATIQSAIDLFGSGSCQEINVTNAWNAVGVGAPYNPISNFQISANYESFCNTSYITLTAPNITNCQYNWISDAKLNIISGQNTNTIIIEANPNTDGIANITLNLTSPCFNFSLDKSIQITPSITNFRYTGSNPGNPFTGEPLSFEVNPVPDATSYTWYNDNIFLATTSEPFYSTFNWSCGDHRIYVQATTSSCGNSDLGGGEYYWGLCSFSYRYSIYPNPSNEQLTIESSSISQKVNSISEILSDFSVKLFNEKGDVLRSALNKKSGESVIIDTQKIPEGTYFLHITEGKETIKRQIIIKH